MRYSLILQGCLIYLSASGLAIHLVARGLQAGHRPALVLGASTLLVGLSALLAGWRYARIP